MLLSGWNNYPSVNCEAVRPEKYALLKDLESPYIARGVGRSYSDAAVNSKGIVVLMERLDRFISFDPESGIVRCEGGTTLEEILNVFVPRGWFLPVVPGTEKATVGGSIAADVHGKNHFYAGSFGRYVQDISLILPDGSAKTCSSSLESELFWATVGGMGLTGVIGEASIQLTPIESAYISVSHTPVENLDSLFQKMETACLEKKYAVAWINPSVKGTERGQGIVMTGDHASREQALAQFSDPYKLEKEKSRSLPFSFPSWGISSSAVNAFNALYMNINKHKTSPYLTDYRSFFFPLDKISNWNQFFGKKGFIQYQFAVPLKEAQTAISSILEETAKSDFTCTLAVLKRFGPGGDGLLSFPIEGYSLALDFPFSERILGFLNRLDSIVLKHHGRIYLAKDVRLPEEHLPAMYPKLEEWKKIKARIDPDSKIVSNLSRRLRLGG